MCAMIEYIIDYLGQLMVAQGDVGAPSYSVVPAIIAAGAALGGTLLQSRLNKDSWQKNNEYNSPSNQIRRLREAGVNPASVLYGQKTVENTSGSAPVPADIPAAFDSANNAVQNSFMRRMTKNLTAAQVDAAKEQAGVAHEQAEGLKLDNEIKRANLPNELLGAQALQELYINVDADGTVTYGDLDAEGNFVPRYDKDSNLLPGLHNAMYSQKGKELIGKGFLVDYQAYENNRSKLQNDLTEKFGKKNARAVIRNLDAAAYQSRQTGKAMQLDNDVFENLSIGGKTAGYAVDGLKVLLSVLRGK